jgi:hypothetical protein
MEINISNVGCNQAPLCEVEGGRVNDKERVVQLERQITELKARLPKHSVPAAMIIELEDLEDELEILKARTSRDAD